jgi:hypothetical protein
MLDALVENVGVEIKSLISSLIKGVTNRWSQEVKLEPRPKSELHVVQQAQHHQYHRVWVRQNQHHHH